MNKSLIGLMMLLVLMGNAFSSQTNQNELLRWEFEEGAGNIVFDLTGNQYNGLINGAKYDNLPVKWGVYSIDFDGQNDYILALNNRNTPEQFTINMWIMVDVYTADDYFVEIDDTTETFELEFNGNNGNFELGYYNDNLVYSHQLLDTTTFPLDQWVHIVVSVDTLNDTISYYRDNLVIVDNAPIVGGYHRTETPKSFKVGANHENLGDFSGWFDAIKFYDFQVDTSQVNELFNSNSITLVKEEIINETEEVVIETMLEYDLIQDGHSPLTNSTNNYDFNFNINLNSVGTCEIYVDNSVYKVVENSIAYSVPQDLGDGNYTYFLYCYYDELTTRYYELTEPMNFQVETLPPTTIHFNLQGTDFDINSKPLEIVSPCLEPGMTLMGALDKYRPLANPGGATFKDVVNGQATMTMPVGEHEFCLIHGLITYNSYDKVTDWNPNNVIKQIKLGSFDLPNNLTTSYSIGLENFEMYDKTSPKAWGQTWITLISSLLAFGLGLLILGAGITTGEGKAVLIGGLLVMFSLGYQISNLLVGIF